MTRMERILDYLGELDGLNAGCFHEDESIGWYDNGEEIPLTFGDVEWLRSLVLSKKEDENVPQVQEDVSDRGTT